MIRALSSVALVALLAACAPQPPTDGGRPAAPQRTVIETVPADAMCRVIGRTARRDAQRTPMTIDPRALGFPVEVICEAPGYLATTEMLHPRPLPRVLEAAAERQAFSPMADLAPAAGAAADSLVPFRLTVVLRAALLETLAARNAFYDALRVQREARWSDLMGRAEVDCAAPETSRAGASATTPPEICRRAYTWLRELRDADLRRLEIDRRRATFR